MKENVKNENIILKGENTLEDPLTFSKIQLNADNVNRMDPFLPLVWNLERIIDRVHIYPMFATNKGEKKMERCFLHSI